MSPGVAQVRADICHDCPTPCEPRPDVGDPCASCHLRRWGQHDCNPAAPAPTGLRGLGDLVAVVADPIARAIGLDKRKCGCAQRQQTLNALVPFTKALPKQD